MPSPSRHHQTFSENNSSILCDSHRLDNSKLRIADTANLKSQITVSHLWRIEKTAAELMDNDLATVGEVMDKGLAPLKLAKTSAES